MALKLISEHYLDSPLPRGRRLAFCLSEGALLSLLSLFCFLIAGYCDSLIPFYKSHSSAASSYRNEMVSLIVASGAGESDGAGGLLSYENRASQYLKNAAYSSLKANGEEKASSFVYDDCLVLNEENDLPYRYYVVFKPSNLASYSAKEHFGINEYWDNFAEAKGYFDGSSSHPFLSLDASFALHEYFINESYAKGKEIAAKLKESYIKLCKSVVNDFKETYSPYLQTYSFYETERDAIYAYKAIESLLCHLLSCLVYFFVFPFILKERSTIGRRVLKAYLIHRNGSYFAWFERLARALLLFLETLIIPSCIPLLFYGSGAAELFVASLFGPFSLLFFSFFSLALLIFSYTGCFYLKGKASWSEAIFKGRSVDGREE